jgi:hypothetical protein
MLPPLITYPQVGWLIPAVCFWLLWLDRFLAYMHYGNFFVINLCDTYYSSDRSSFTDYLQPSICVSLPKTLPFGHKVLGKACLLPLFTFTLISACTHVHLRMNKREYDWEGDKDWEGESYHWTIYNIMCYHGRLIGQYHPGMLFNQVWHVSQSA